MPRLRWTLTIVALGLVAVGSFALVALKNGVLDTQHAEQASNGSPVSGSQSATESPEQSAEEFVRTHAPLSEHEFLSAHTAYVSAGKGAINEVVREERVEKAFGAWDGAVVRLGHFTGWAAYTTEIEPEGDNKVVSFGIKIEDDLDLFAKILPASRYYDVVRALSAGQQKVFVSGNMQYESSGDMAADSLAIGGPNPSFYFELTYLGVVPPPSVDEAPQTAPAGTAVTSSGEGSKPPPPMQNVLDEGATRANPHCREDQPCAMDGFVLKSQPTRQIPGGGTEQN